MTATLLTFAPPATGKYDPSRAPDNAPGWTWVTTAAPPRWSYRGGDVQYQKDRAAMAAAGQVHTLAGAGASSGTIFGLSYVMAAAIAAAAFLLLAPRGGRR